MIFLVVTSIFSDMLNLAHELLWNCLPLVYVVWEENYYVIIVFELLVNY